MVIIRAALGDEVEHAATGSTKLSTEQTSLNRDLGDRVFVIDLAGWARDRNVVVLGAVNQVVVAARALAVYGKLRCVTKLRASRSSYDAGQQATKVIRIEICRGETGDLRLIEIAALDRFTCLQ